MPWRLVLAVLVLAGLIVAPRLTAVLSSARRWSAASTPAARAEAAWEELRLGLQDLGAMWAWTWTPRGVQERLAAEYDLGDAGESALARLVAAIESARYAPPGSVVEAHPMAGFSADLTQSSAGSSGSSAGSAAGSAAGPPPDGVRGDVRTVLSRVAATMPRGRRWRAHWAPPSAQAMLVSLLMLRRGSAGGPDGESMAGGTDTITSENREPTKV